MEAGKKYADLRKKILHFMIDCGSINLLLLALLGKR